MGETFGSPLFYSDMGPGFSLHDQMDRMLGDAVVLGYLCLAPSICTNCQNLFLGEFGLVVFAPWSPVSTAFCGHIIHVFLLCSNP